LAKSWTDDPARLKATYVPSEVSFATKPQLAARMIERAVATAVPFRWVVADTVYGVGHIERDLRQSGKGYVLGVDAAHVFRAWDKPRRIASRKDASIPHASPHGRFGDGLTKPSHENPTANKNHNYDARLAPGRPPKATPRWCTIISNLDVRRALRRAVV
jgi:DDE superfamily endonuclease